MKTLALLLILFALPAAAGELHGTFIRAYDGDTIHVSIDGKDTTVRLLNVDTAEIKGKCPAEIDLAIRARDFTRAWSIRGPLTLTTTKRTRDKYGRLLAFISRDNEDLGEKLIEAGLAVRWAGKRNQHWCDRQ